MLMQMSTEDWRTLAALQGGVVTRRQLAAAGVDRWAIRHRLRAGRWIGHTPTIIGTHNGPLTRDTLLWIGVLHGGPHAVLGDLTAAALLGLRNWHREEITVLVPRGTDTGSGHPGIRFRSIRRPVGDLRVHLRGLPVCRIEPAILLFASRQDSRRTAGGVLSAAVQQRLTTAGRPGSPFPVGRYDAGMRPVCSATPTASGGSPTVGSCCWRWTGVSTWRSSTGRTTSPGNERWRPRTGW